MAAESPVIATHALTKIYKDTTALKALNLQVSRNSIFGFLGPNGAGKTTTIKLLLGLPLPTVLPIVFTALWCVVFTALAVWRFGREEF